MHRFNSLLLREKFIIRDVDGVRSKQNQRALIALSNRMDVPLHDAQGNLSECFIVRAQNMHLCVRFAARIVSEYSISGPIMPRSIAFDWSKAWNSILNDYEHAFNQERWVCIYFKGKPVFSEGEHHPFLDMIEKCDAENDKDYDYAIPLAEKLFQNTGKNIEIEHEANAALSADFDDKHGRCGIILRGSRKKTIFSYSVQTRSAKDNINIPQALGASAAFLEAIQLAFSVGFNTTKILYGHIKRFSMEEKKNKQGQERINRLKHEISAFENAFRIHYRPEKPDFSALLSDAEELAKNELEPVQQALTNNDEKDSKSTEEANLQDE